MSSFWEKIFINVIVRTMTKLFRRKKNEENKKELSVMQGNADKEINDVDRVQSGS
jgi:hypothetical protein